MVLLITWMVILAGLLAGLWFPIAHRLGPELATLITVMVWVSEAVAYTTLIIVPLWGRKQEGVIRLTSLQAAILRMHVAWVCLGTGNYISEGKIQWDEFFSAGRYRSLCHLGSIIWFWGHLYWAIYLFSFTVGRVIKLVWIALSYPCQLLGKLISWVWNKTYIYVIVVMVVLLPILCIGGTQSLNDLVYVLAWMGMFVIFVFANLALSAIYSNRYLTDGVPDDNEFWVASLVGWGWTGIYVYIGAVTTSTPAWIWWVIGMVPLVVLVWSYLEQVSSEYRDRLRVKKRKAVYVDLDDMYTTENTKKAIKSAIKDYRDGICPVVRQVVVPE